MYKIMRDQTTSIRTETVFRGSLYACHDWIGDTVIRNKYLVKDIKFWDGQRGIETTSQFGSKQIFRIVPV